MNSCFIQQIVCTDKKFIFQVLKVQMWLQNEMPQKVADVCERVASRKNTPSPECVIVCSCVYVCTCGCWCLKMFCCKYMPFMNRDSPWILFMCNITSSFFPGWVKWPRNSKMPRQKWKICILYKLCFSHFTLTWYGTDMNIHSAGLHVGLLLNRSYWTVISFVQLVQVTKSVVSGFMLRTGQSL